MSRTVARTLTVLLVVSACFSDKGGSDTTIDLGSTSAATPTTSTGTGADGTSTLVTITTDIDPPAPTTGGDASPFVFASDPVDAYEQIDRHGAVEAATAGIVAAQGLGFTPGSDITLRDAYNASDPVADIAGVWIPELTKSMTFFHDALDDDLMALGLVPATVDETITQAGPVVVPDAIKYDPSQPAAYPNGRRLEDPVVDITFAAVLLKLGPQQPLELFAQLPLNPPTNDVPFSPEFPFLAAPHAP